MKKRIFAIVMSLLVAFSALQVFEISYKASAAATPTASDCWCTKKDGKYSAEHAWGCPCKDVKICTKCGYLVDLPGYNSTLFPDSHYKYCELKENKPTDVVIPGAFMEITAANANFVDNNDKGVDQYTKEAELRTKYSGYRIFVLTGDMWGAPVNNHGDIFVPEGKKVVIDLNGRKFKGTGEGSVITNYGELIIEDSRPDRGHEGVMHGRGYYYFDDEGGVEFEQTRYIPDALWVQGSTYEDGIKYDDKYPNSNGMPSSAKTPMFGGIIHSGRVSRNVDAGKTFEDLYNTGAGDTNLKRKFYLAHFVLGFKFRGSSANYGRGGGGIYNTGKLIMNGGAIVGNDSYHGEGSAVHNVGTGATFTMNGGKIMYNFGKSTVCCSGGATFTMNSGTIFRNYNIGNGGIYLKSDAGDSVKSSAVIGVEGDDADFATAKTKVLTETYNPTYYIDDKVNQVNGRPRAIITKQSDYGVPVIDSNVSIAGIMTNGNGGGICSQNGNLTINTAIITNNWAHYRGGGIDIFSTAKVTLGGTGKNILVQNNYCEYKGGGIAVRNPSGYTDTLSLDIVSDGVQVIGNKAGFGGGVYLSRGKMTMSAGSISQNEATGFYVKTNNFYKNVGCKNHEDIKNQTIIDFYGKTTHSIKVENKKTVVNEENISAGSYATPSGNGGGVFLEEPGTNLTMTGGLIDSNKSPRHGAGIFISNGKLTMSGGKISNNVMSEDSEQAYGAGAHIYMSSTNQVAFEMTGGEICNNESTWSHGGGVYSSGSVNLSGNAKIHHNSSYNNGGGIYASTANFTLSGNAEISDNYTTEDIGGGVLLNNPANGSTKFSMSGGSIKNNKALGRSGGGIYVINSDFEMTGGTIDGNTANFDNFLNNNSNWSTAAHVEEQYGKGGGVVIQGGKVTITGNSKIINNQAAFSGGGIYLYTNTDATPTLTIGTDNASAAQPEISNNKLTIDFKKIVKDGVSVFQGDHRFGGGAIAVGGGADIKIYNSKIHHNETSSAWDSDHINGGAIAVLNTQDKQASIYIKGGAMYNNVSHRNWAGGIYVAGKSSVTLDGGEYYNNSAIDNAGFARISSGTLDIKGDAKIYNNSTEQYIGGAVELSEGTINMHSGEVYNNKVMRTTDEYNASRSHGGAFVVVNGTFNMYGGAIYANETGSHGDGGAVAITGTGTVNVYGGKVGLKPDGTAAGNLAKNNGGAIYVKNGTINIGKSECDGSTDAFHNTKTPTASACGHPIVANNTAVNGGGLYVASGSTNFYCGDMKSNSASQNGGGVYVAGGTVNIASGQVTNNTSTNKGGGMYVADGNVTIGANGKVTGNESLAGDANGDSLYMTGGNVTYTDGANGATFADKAGTTTGVVVAGGTLEKTGATEVAAVYFKDRETGEEKKAFEVPLGTYIMLPMGDAMFPNYEGHTFIGWQYPEVKGFVTSSSEYKAEGSQIEVINNTGSPDAPKMTIYGVWARTVNTVKFYNTTTKSDANKLAGDTTYTYSTSSSSFVVPSVDQNNPLKKIGYTFVDWSMYQEADSNANWEIPKGGAISAIPSGTKDAKGKFGDLYLVANWSATMTYNVVSNTPDVVGGTVSRAKDDIKVGESTTTVSSVTATPATNYTFIGWYYDEACTQLATDQATVTPTLNANGYYDNIKYYAKFELQYKDLIIKTTGADVEQTFVFTVEGQSGYAKNVDMQVIITTGEGGIATIKNIPAGNYKVYENNVEVNNHHQGDTWTWRYTDTEIQDANVNGQMDSDETDVDTVTFVYNNPQQAYKAVPNWLNGFSNFFNKLIAG